MFEIEMNMHSSLSAALKFLNSSTWCICPVFKKVADCDRENKPTWERTFQIFCYSTVWMGFCIVFALMKRVVLKIWAMGGNSIFFFGYPKKRRGGLLLSNKEHLESCSIQHQHNSTQTRVCLVFNFQAHMCFYNAIYLAMYIWCHVCLIFR